MLWLLHTNDLWFIIIHLFDLFLPPSSLSLMDRVGMPELWKGGSYVKIKQMGML